MGGEVTEIPPNYHNVALSVYQLIQLEAGWGGGGLDGSATVALYR